MNMIGVMNDTKWEELRQAMYALRPLAPRFRIKDRDCDEPWPVDGEWFYHFRGKSYDSIEWVDLFTPDPEQRQLVLDILCTVHVPGTLTPDGFRIYGWVAAGSVVAYIE